LTFSSTVILSKEILTQNIDSDSKLNIQPPLVLSKPIQIRLEEEKAYAVRIVLEFLYTDRILSLEGKGRKEKFYFKK
jgi:hypothetical protein